MILKRISNYLFLHISLLPMKSVYWRPLVCKWGGVKICDPKNTFIGENVTFDSLYPEDIIVEKGVVITVGCVILSHFIKTKNPDIRGKVHIKRNAFLGCNTIICKPVIIGENSVIGAGSIVTKDIPDNEVWAGNPAKFIRKR